MMPAELYPDRLTLFFDKLEPTATRLRYAWRGSAFSSSCGMILAAEGETLEETVAALLEELAAYFDELEHELAQRRP